MIHDLGRWHFDGIYYEDYNGSFPAIRESLKILMTNLISSKILLPKTMDNIPLEYNTIDELLDKIETSVYLENGSEFDIWGDTIIYGPNGEEVYEDIVSIESFRPTEQHFVLAVKTDHWLPMIMDSETYNFSWNLDHYQLNHHRISALIKKLDEELNWQNKGFLFEESWFVSFQIGYDFFMKESVIIREYEANPNTVFDLESYLTTIKKLREQYSR